MNEKFPSLTSFSDQKRLEAMKKYEIIKPHILDQKSIRLISKDKNIPIRTIQSWVQKYSLHGLKGLVRKERSDLGKVRIRKEVTDEVERLILANKNVSITSIHRKICHSCKEKKIEKPSYSQIFSVAKSIAPALKKLAHEGKNEYQNSYDMVHRMEASRPNEIWQADHTLLDIVVYNENNMLERPWLTVIMDDYSRAVAGYFLSFQAPSAIQTSLALHQAIWQKRRKEWEICGIPEKFYTDHGSDFTSHHLEQVAVDLKINLVFSTVGVPRGRGKIERFFLTINQLLLQDLPGYIENTSVRNHLTFQKLEDKLNEFIINVYHHRSHGTTKVAPIDRWSQSGFLLNMPESLEDLDLLLLNVAKARKVHADGIYFQGLRYIDTNLAAYVGETVIIRYDPRDLAEIRVFYQDKYLCTAIAPEISDYTVDLKDIVAARNQRRKNLNKELTNNQTLVDSIVLTKQNEREENVEKSKPKKSKLKRYFNE
ncbi:Mu transposase C-terminal domain-containing protein [Shimazuella sp. AN120528]|uniref:Mu transposase C-terminal domain-containing protein n=1 Tax=Shimazuella soli TaxID=1892854 RepID=UPI001F0DC0BE|nr:Mu transposase C-terminal domain-containing protein [Shimazuella soli]MCH5584889.1 Mu transposase C-terminal domain-containing protein [Shimazuella soli]